MIAVNLLNKILNKFGAELSRFPNNELKRRKSYLKHYQITKVFDVGANVGKYGIGLREIGYKGDIISFEPLSKTYLELNKKTEKDKKWRAYNIALGDFDGESEINIAGNVDSSSLLDMLPAHLNSAPQSKYIGKEKIIVKKLDNIYKDLCNENDQVYMKIDTQGFEKQVLDGALDSLSKIKGLQIEMSIIPLYKGSLTYLEMISYLKEKGFEIQGMDPGFSDPSTGRLLQFDGIFFRE